MRLLPEPQPASPGRLPVEPVITPPFALLLFTQGVFGLAFSLFFLLPKFLTRELAATGGQIGLTAALAPAAGVLGIPLIAVAVERFGRKRLVTLGATVAAMAAFGYLWVDRVGPLLITLRCVQGLAFSLAFNAAATLAADLAPRARLSQALGWFGVSFLATNAAAPLIAEPIADHFGWKSVFLFSTGLTLLAALLSTRLIEPAHDQPRAGARAVAPADDTILAALLKPRVLAVCFGALVAGAGLGAVFTFHQPYALKLGADRVGGFFLGYTAAAVLVRVLLGGLPDRVGRLRVGAASLGGYVVVVAAMGSLTPALLVPFGAAFGLVHGLMYPALNAVAVEDATDHQRGAVMSYFNGAFNLGVAGASLGLGYVADAFGYRVLFWLTAGVVLLALPVLAWGRASSRG
ncbi:MAG: MFS transporter [Polyangiaceae bacterium]|nr:MFS transporter [Polyangiaceae bacterium]MCW5788857.1 MFS transporter [Polyangiaceae bacterium]